RQALPGSEERFGMLEMVREYAQERLLKDEASAGAATTIKRQHAEYYLNMVVAAWPDMMGPRQNELMNNFEIERGNLRLALAWARDNTEVEYATKDMELALNAGSALRRFWQSRGHVGEGRQWLESLLALPV